MLGAAIAQGVAQLGTAVYNSIAARRSQQRSFRHNRQMSEMAYGHDLEMWNRQSEWNRAMWDAQNEYNTPSAQKQRLLDAGLNPALMYGNASAGGQAGAIQRAEMPKYQAARADYQHMPLQVPNILAAFNNLRLQNAQVDNVKAQEKLTREKALTESALRVPSLEGRTHDAAVKMVNAEYAKEMKQLEVDSRRQALENAKVDKMIKGEILPKTKAERQLRQEDLKWMREYGMRPNDPLQYRWIVRFLEQFGLGSLTGR